MAARTAYGPGTTTSKRLLDQGRALPNLGPVPAGTVLVGEQYQLTRSIGAGGAARVDQQHQGALVGTWQASTTSIPPGAGHLGSAGGVAAPDREVGISPGRAPRSPARCDDRVPSPQGDDVGAEPL